MAFKIGNIIRVYSPVDAANKYNHLYKVLEVYDNGYDLLSLQNGSIHKNDSLLYLVTEVLQNERKFTDVKSFIDHYYRLATEAEILLYGRKEV